MSEYNCIVVLGPTAVGKTYIGVNIASHFDLPVISADSRQVYKGLDLGSGKDLDEYTVTVKNADGSEEKKEVPHYLIDIASLDQEYNVFNYQMDFYKVFNSLDKIPVVVGGTGMYLDAVIRGYDFVYVPENAELRKDFENKSLEELGQMLLKLKPDLHNKSDLLERERVIRALEIQLYMKSSECVLLRKKQLMRPVIKPYVIGTTVSRDVLHKNIKIRLRERIEHGMIEEVEGLHKNGASWERLEKLGLEYRFVSQYLEGKISSKEEMEELLYHAISQFAKRQETWFRGMQKKGVTINWLPLMEDKKERLKVALCEVQSKVF
jgi:tRNA dimethylallyltransferase